MHSLRFDFNHHKTSTFFKCGKVADILLSQDFVVEYIAIMGLKTMLRFSLKFV